MSARHCARRLGWAIMNWNTKWCMLYPEVRRCATGIDHQSGQNQLRKP